VVHGAGGVTKKFQNNNSAVVLTVLTRTGSRHCGLLVQELVGTLAWPWGVRGPVERRAAE